MEQTPYITYIFSPDSIGILFPPAPPPSLLGLIFPAAPLPPCNSTVFPLRTDSGVSHLNGCRLPISRIWAKKLDPVQLGKKSIFPWKSHAVQLARVSPLLETLSLTSSHPSPGRRFKESYWIELRIYGRVGRAQAEPASLRAIRLFYSLEYSPLLAPSRAATPLCPENGRYYSTSISY